MTMPKVPCPSDPVCASARKRSASCCTFHSRMPICSYSCATQWTKGIYLHIVLDASEVVANGLAALAAFAGFPGWLLCSCKKHSVLVEMWLKGVYQEETC